jgi:two-component system sensor histidine kinase TctE
MSTGLQRRLLLLLLAPLFLLAGLNTWFDYRLAGNASVQQDRMLLAMVPLLADSVVARSIGEDDALPLLLAPAVDEFLSSRNGLAAFSMATPDGRIRAGEVWLVGVTPNDFEPVFYSEEQGGVQYRVVAQRVRTAAGDLVMRLADGSDGRQQWLNQLWFKVVLPNAVLIVALFFSVNWAVRRALRPLLELKEQVERRSPKDLSALNVNASPDEVRPLVIALNRLFELVNAQASSQHRFVADAAHQLRTPLAALQAQVEAWAQAANHGGKADWRDRAVHQTDVAVTRQPVDITVSAEQVNALRAAARRTSQLANQLLALSRVEATQAHGAVQRVDLAQLCETVFLQYLDAATAKGIDLGMECHPAHISGQDWLLREMLGNLVDNALKYTAPGGHVTVRCGMHGAGLRPTAFVEVEDDGPGIPADQIARVLEPFYRMPGSAGEGSGLGLAIAQEIAMVHSSVLVLTPRAHGRGLRATVDIAV